MIPSLATPRKPLQSLSSLETQEAATQQANDATSIVPSMANP